ncbi:MAG: hypothetical protein KGD63_03760 [Candidatus Lokiarchaeota archaeon]|nr:hypothetical protein [Candidatus Lokiarchaeota archaeon]
MNNYNKFHHGYNYLKLYSGKKGFHFYILNEERNLVKELSGMELEEILSWFRVKKYTNLIDNINFQGKNGSFDLHRNFSLPNTVDGATGVIIKEGLEIIVFNDKLERMN